MPHPFATTLQARRLVATAGAAPSVHNTQPWRFQRRGAEILELYADTDRQLRVTDPRGREMLISCGAALLNLRLAFRAAGYRALVWPQRRSRFLGPLALLRAVEDGPPSVAEARLYGAIPNRHTNRGRFDERPVPWAILAELQGAAYREGARLDLLNPADTARLLDLVAAADAALSADPGYRDELAAWTSHRSRTDGVPWYAFGPIPGRRGIALRDFGLTQPVSGREVVDITGRPQMATLSITGDEPGDWLRAGQALQRVLLTATRYGLSCSFATQPLDLREMTASAPSNPPVDAGVQMILRLGYGRPVPGTPRRPSSELLPEDL